MTNTWHIFKEEKIETGTSIIVVTKDAAGNRFNPPEAVVHIGIQDAVTGVPWDWPGVDLVPGSKNVGGCEFDIVHRNGVHTVTVVQPGTESDTAYLPVISGGWKVIFQLEEGEEPPVEPPPPPPPPPPEEPDWVSEMQRAHYYHSSCANHAARAAWLNLMQAWHIANFLAAHGITVRTDFVTEATMLTLSNFVPPDDDDPPG